MRRFAAIGMTECRNAGEVQVADERIATRSGTIDPGELVEREANGSHPVACFLSSTIPPASTSVYASL